MWWTLLIAILNNHAAPVVSDDISAVREALFYYVESWTVPVVELKPSANLRVPVIGVEPVATGNSKVYDDGLGLKTPLFNQSFPFVLCCRGLMGMLTGAEYQAYVGRLRMCVFSRIPQVEITSGCEYNSVCSWNFGADLGRRGNADSRRVAAVRYLNGEAEKSGLLGNTESVHIRDFETQPRTVGSMGGIRASFGMPGGQPSEYRGRHSSGQGEGAHSELPPDRRSLFVRVSGLVDGRLSRDSVTGEPWLACAVAMLIGLAGSWGIWRLWSGRWLSGTLLVGALLVLPPVVFSVR